MCLKPHILSLPFLHSYMCCWKWELRETRSDRELGYLSATNNFSKFISYNGYYFFVLPRNNSITFTPKYSLSHTDQNSDYSESGYTSILNSAVDNTNYLSGDLKFKHDFGKFGSLMGFVKGSYQYNRTSYSGSTIGLDRAKSSRIGFGANYKYKTFIIN